ncbi:hypothetical protein [Vibrio cincinnatiensis]|uniref:hypothetical protein n=1 Tax=Vibrio cincinnatiensis TaxID=675 RepID=UPI001EDE08A0|nr:hypothetical protein [Vibrio cincinnatiensis]
MNKTEAITNELELEVNKAAKNPLLKMVAAPLRLLLVWMKETNERLNALERGCNVEESN